VRLNTQIAGSGGTLTIYLVFFTKTTTFDGNFWGEAPTLSGTYGQYDNGANVFTFYDNFAGTTLSSKWTVYENYATAAANNGLTVALSQGSGYCYLVSPIFTYPLVAETYTSSGYSVLGLATGQSAGYGLYWTGGTDYMAYDYFGSLTAIYSVAQASFPAGIWQVSWPATGSEYFSDGLGNAYSGTDSKATIGDYATFIGQPSGTASSSTYTWARMRAYPPGNVFPSVAFGSAIPESIAYVPIVLANTKSPATPVPFQQLVNFNPSLYSGYEASDLGNVRFCADSLCATMLYSWLEGCTPSCSPSATAANAWVQLTTAISANGGTLTIYLVFLPISTEFDGVYAGEAPEITTPYALYDNGANVFSEYNNGNSLFASSSTGTGGSGPSTSTTAPSPFTHAIVGGVSGGGAAATTWTTNGNTGSPALPSSYVAQMLVQISGTSPLVDLLTNVASITSGRFYVFRLDARSGSYDLVGYYSSGGTATTVISTTTTTSSKGVWYQLTAVDAADQLSLYKATESATSNFGTPGTQEVSPIGGQGYSGGGIAVTTDGATSTDSFTLIVVRAYPPGNTMPGATPGNARSNRNGVVLTLANTGSTSWLASLTLIASTNPGRLYNLTVSFQSPFSKQVILGTGVTNQNGGSQVTLAGTGSIAILVGAWVNSAGTSTITMGLKIQTPSASGTSSYCYDVIALTVT
jgi:hypothetical protein